MNWLSTIRFDCEDEVISDVHGLRGEEVRGRLLDGVASGKVPVLGRAGSCSQSQVQGKATFEHPSAWRGHQQPSEQPLEYDLLPQSVEGEAGRLRVRQEPCF
jgi:hypothetical protein